MRMEQKKVLFGCIDGILNALEQDIAIAMPDDDELQNKFETSDDEQHESIARALMILFKQHIVLRVYGSIFEAEVTDGWIGNIMNAIECEVKESLRLLSSQSQKDEITSYVSDLRNTLLNSIAA